MKLNTFPLAVYSLFLFFILQNHSYALNDIAINKNNEFIPIVALNQTQQAYEKTKDYTFVLTKQERIGKKMGKKETIFLKFRKPHDVYMKWIEKPNKGQEVIYQKGRNEGNLTAHKGGLISFITLNLSPKSNLVMRGQHHSIEKAGIGATNELIKKSLLKGLERDEITINYHGIVTINGKPSRHIEAIFPKTIEGTPYIVQEDETLWDISAKTNQAMYVIMSVNKGVDSPNDIKQGQTILIPYHYCYRSIIFTDIQTGFLTRLEIYDWNNELYELYEYNNLKINVGLMDIDFDKTNPDYNF